MRSGNTIFPTLFLSAVAATVAAVLALSFGASWLNIVLIYYGVGIAALMTFLLLAASVLRDNGGAAVDRRRQTESQ